MAQASFHRREKCSLGVKWNSMVRLNWAWAVSVDITLTHALLSAFAYHPLVDLTPFSVATAAGRVVRKLDRHWKTKCQRKHTITVKTADTFKGKKEKTADVFCRNRILFHLTGLFLLAGAWTVKWIKKRKKKNISRLIPKSFFCLSAEYKLSSGGR